MISLTGASDHQVLHRLAGLDVLEGDVGRIGSSVVGDAHVRIRPRRKDDHPPAPYPRRTTIGN